MKFTIVTPLYNMEKWLPVTIRSVIDQEGDFEIEYILISDNSTDRTVEIANQFKSDIESGKYPVKCKNIKMQIVDRKEGAGMYDAINYGFNMGSGDIFAWINGDDSYVPGAFKIICELFKQRPDINWVKGVNQTIDENFELIRPGHCRVYRHDWLKQGIYGMEAYFVEQENCFWRKNLWEKVGNIPTLYRAAGDYWLWLQFAKYAPMYSLNHKVGRFMKRPGQISKGVSKYKKEQNTARLELGLTFSLERFFVKIFFSLWSRGKDSWESVFLFLYKYLFLKKDDTYLECINGKFLTLQAESFYCKLDNNDKL